MLSHARPFFSQVSRVSHGFLCLMDFSQIVCSRCNNYMRIEGATLFQETENFMLSNQRNKLSNKNRFIFLTDIIRNYKGPCFVDNLSFYVDNELLSAVLKTPQDTVRSVAKMPANNEYFWRDGSKLAPFDKEVSIIFL